MRRAAIPGRAGLNTTVAVLGVLVALAASPEASVASAAALGSAGAAVAPPLYGNWTELKGAPHPGNLSEFAFTWVPGSAGGYGLLFGGRTSRTGLSNETWTFSGGRWSRLNLTVHPSSRRGAMMTYDAQDGYALLFGGSNGTSYLNDTWTFSGGAWSRLAPRVAPPARRVGTLSYDPATHAAILFGGHGGGLAGRYQELDDTWSFVGGNWTRLNPKVSPPARSEASSAFDAAANVLVLFGGYHRSAPHYVALNDTWFWGNNNWHRLDLPAAPPERDGMAFAYDAAVGGIVLAGGHYDSRNASAREFNDTWVLRGPFAASLAWTAVPTVRAFPDSDAANMVYDPSSSSLILFGGRTGIPAQVWFHATWKLHLT